LCVQCADGFVLLPEEAAPENTNSGEEKSDKSTVISSDQDSVQEGIRCVTPAELTEHYDAIKLQTGGGQTATDGQNNTSWTAEEGNINNNTTLKTEEKQEETASPTSKTTKYITTTHQEENKSKKNDNNKDDMRLLPVWILVGLCCIFLICALLLFVRQRRIVKEERLHALQAETAYHENRPHIEPQPRKSAGGGGVQNAQNLYGPRKTNMDKQKSLVPGGVPRVSRPTAASGKSMGLTRGIGRVDSEKSPTTVNAVNKVPTVKKTMLEQQDQQQQQQQQNRGGQVEKVESIVKKDKLGIVGGRKSDLAPKSRALATYVSGKTKMAPMSKVQNFKKDDLSSESENDIAKGPGVFSGDDAIHADHASLRPTAAKVKPKPKIGMGGAAGVAKAKAKLLAALGKGHDHHDQKEDLNSQDEINLQPAGKQGAVKMIGGGGGGGGKGAPTGGHQDHHSGKGWGKAKAAAIAAMAVGHHGEEGGGKHGGGKKGWKKGVIG